MSRLIYRVFVFPCLRPFDWLPALALAPDPWLRLPAPDPGPQFVSTSPGSEFVFTGPGP